MFSENDFEVHSQEGSLKTLYTHTSTALSEADSFAFKTNGQKPRNSSTNMRVLSARISALQREMDPTIKMTGTINATGTSNKRQVLKRRFRVLLSSTTSNSVDVTSNNLGIPDGARLLNFTVTNLSSRVLQVTIPNDSVLTAVAGSTEAPIAGLSRMTTAPLSRFPGITVDIPDLLARPLDAGAGAKLFTCSALDQSTSASFSIAFTAEFVTNIYL